MVLDLRLIKIGCRETVNLFFIPPLFLHKKPPPSTPKKSSRQKIHRWIISPQWYHKSSEPNELFWREVRGLGDFGRKAFNFQWLGGLFGGNCGLICMFGSLICIFVGNLILGAAFGPAFLGGFWAAFWRLGLERRSLMFLFFQFFCYEICWKM